MIRWRLVSELGVESWGIGNRDWGIEVWSSEMGNRKMEQGK
jgi:hypothetical protein